MEPFELLTDIDKQRLHDYIYAYGCSGNSYPKGQMASMEYLLRNWNEAKEQIFQTIFKDKLIIEVPIEYNVGVDELEERVRNMMFSYENEQVIGTQMRETFLNTIVHDPETDDKWLIEYLFSAYELAKNSFDPYDNHSSYSFPLANGKKYKVNAGTKPLRIIRKLCESWGIEGFDEFQIVHSLALNQKKLSGNLCLSIHPMDYITMSDNGYDWDSCMRWRSGGEYRQGTVEMMNSPCVIVGYLKGEKNWYWDSYSNMVNKDVQEDSGLWNSKKWRCLFVYDPRDRFCLSVKNYPYSNNMLTEIAIQTITKLAGWEAPTYPFARTYNEQEIAGQKVHLLLETSHMYNDFGDTDHFIAVNPNNEDDIDDKYYSYSGLSQCMWCGTLDVCCQDEEDHRVLCDSCESFYRCCNCGDTFSSDDNVYWVDDLDAYVCSYCAESYLITCPISNIETLDDNAINIHLFDREKNEIYSRSIQVYDCVWSDYPEQWAKMTTMESVEMRDIRDGWWRYHCVEINSLTEWGRQLFGLDEYEDLLPIN